MNQGFLIGDTLPFSAELHPGVGKASVMDEGLAIVGYFGAVGAGNDGGVAVDVDTGVRVGNLLGLKERSLRLVRYCDLF